MIGGTPIPVLDLHSFDIKEQETNRDAPLLYDECQQCLHAKLLMIVMTIWIMAIWVDCGLLTCGAKKDKINIQGDGRQSAPTDCTP